MSYPFTSMRFKIYLTIATACLIGSLFGYFSNQAREQTTGRLTLMSSLNQLERYEKELDSEILNSGFFLYHNYDRLHLSLGEFKKTLERTEELYKQVADKKGGVHELFRAYERHIEQRDALLIRFLTVNSVLKNSAMYIPSLSHRIIKTISEGQRGESSDYLTLLADLTVSLYLTRNSLDLDMLEGVAAPLHRLAATQPPAAEKVEMLHHAVLDHGEVVLKHLPEYSRLLKANLENSRGRELLAQLYTTLSRENDSWLTRLNLLSYIFFAAFLASIALIITLLLKTERENKALNELSLALSTAATSDRLTGLANRFAFDNDQEQRQSPLLFLVNINDFKHINDLYGVKAGDHVLQELALILQLMPPEGVWSRCYRLGGDDFGLLCEKSGVIKPEELAVKIQNTVDEAEFHYRGQEIKINTSIGISAHRPLLETADMALKETKSDRRSRFLIYRPELNLQQRIADNLLVLKESRRALDEDDILVYFQPIVDNLNDQVVKYECLVRLRKTDGSIMPPGLFLDVVKESSLYPEITKRVVEKAFAEFANCQYGFSVNLAIADILDQEVQEFIMAKINADPETARRLTFEILESEGVENAEMVQAFIDKVKSAGCSIAIDDFGSGYSNFAHILRLKVDTIKIDATLIRRIADDNQARIMVRTIVDFCRQLGIETVAEFVDSDEVLQLVKQLKVDYSQGYHLGKPAPGCLR